MATQVKPDGSAMYTSMADCFTKSIKSEGYATTKPPPQQLNSSRSLLPAALYRSPITWYTAPASAHAAGLVVVGCRVLVMWRGFTPAFIKLAPYTIISLTLVDKLTKAVTGKDAL